MPILHLITHPEVVVDPSVPVPDWPLSTQGVRRMSLALKRPWMSQLGSLFSSAERKAMDAASLVSGRFGLSPVVVVELGENDRSTTGYLPKRSSKRQPTASSRARRRACADGSAQLMPSAGSSPRWNASSPRLPGTGTLPSSATAASGRSCFVISRACRLAETRISPAQEEGVSTPSTRALAPYTPGGA